MANYQTMPDVFALVANRGQKGDGSIAVQAELEVGDEVTLYKADRVRRLVEHGWINDPEDHNSGEHTARLTELGAAVANYYGPETHRHLEQSVSDYLKKAKSTLDHEHYPKGGEYDRFEQNGSIVEAFATCEVCGKEIITPLQRRSPPEETETEQEQEPKAAVPA